MLLSALINTTTLRKQNAVVIKDVEVVISDCPHVNDNRYNWEKCFANIVELIKAAEVQEILAMTDCGGDFYDDQKTLLRAACPGINLAFPERGLCQYKHGYRDIFVLDKELMAGLEELGYVTLP